MPQISPLKKLPASRSQCTVTPSPEEIAAAEAAALQKLGAQVNIPGFRPGNAPADQVRERINPDALLEETIRGFLPQVLSAILQEHTLQPLLPPKVEVQSRDPLVLQLTFVERPTVKMKALDTKSFQKTEPKFDDKDIDRMVQYLLEQYRTTQPVDRPAEQGDQVTMNFTGTDQAGAEIEGTRATNYQVVLGSGELLPGFEDGLKGLKKGDEKALDLQFPEKYHAEHLAGKPVRFAVTVTDVHSVSTPTLTPEFVKEKNLGDSPEDVRKRIADSMRQQEEDMDRQRREQALFKAIEEATQVEIAEELIDEEERGLLEDIGRQLQERQESFEDWLKRTNRTPEALREELRKEGERRIRLRFGVQQLLEDRTISLTPEDIAAALERRLQDVPAEQRTQASAYYAEGGEGHAELTWTARVEKLVREMLA